MSEIKSLQVFVTFDSIIDLDLAVLMLIQDKYNNPNVINQSVMKLSLKEIKTLLVNRDHPNPLYVCIDDHDIADNIYDEIIQTQYSELLSYDTHTAIFKLIEVYNNNDGSEVTIFCRTDEERNLIRKYDNDIRIIVGKPEDINVKDYDMFFFKSPKHILEFKNGFMEKHIFVLNYKFNLTFGKDGFAFPDIEVSKLLIPFNKIGMVDVYHRDEGIKIIKPKNN